jgi:hypothetical protein
MKFATGASGNLEAPLWITVPVKGKKPFDDTITVLRTVIVSSFAILHKSPNDTDLTARLLMPGYSFSLDLDIFVLARSAPAAHPGKP